MHELYLQKIKGFEGYTAQAEWDYAQHSVGYGTKARYPGERITLEDAERRFRKEIAEARSIVEQHAAGWDEGTKAALTSLTYNAGTRWINSGLGEAVKAGDIAALKERFVAYNKAGGEVLPGLVKRRLAELEWIGAPAATLIEAATPRPDVVAERIKPAPPASRSQLSDIPDGTRVIGSPTPPATAALRTLASLTTPQQSAMPSVHDVADGDEISSAPQPEDHRAPIVGAVSFAALTYALLEPPLREMRDKEGEPAVRDPAADGVT